jgi:hypothetical protein
MCDNCSEKLITTSQGPQGEQGEQGEPGTNGTNGVLDWTNFNLSCWLAEGIIEPESSNDEITQSFIDSFCEVYQAINVTPIAVNDYRTMNQDSIVYIQVINNDRYYPDVTVTIDVAPSNGTATIESDNKTIKYIPNAGFVGVDDFNYTINDGDSTSTATVSVTVEAVITQQTIEDTIITQLQTFLQSDEYWDLSFAVGDKIAIRNETLVNFDFSSPLTAGIGTGRYSKWAICNGNNGTEDHTNNTLRGFNHADNDYDESAKTGGSDFITLSRNNIPPHRHKYTFFSPQYTDARDINAWKVIQDPIGNYDVSHPGGELGSSQRDGDNGHYINMANTGDGTNNITNQTELKASPDAVDVRNAFSVLILIQKIA